MGKSTLDQHSVDTLGVQDGHTAQLSPAVASIAYAGLHTQVAATGYQAAAEIEGLRSSWINSFKPTACAVEQPLFLKRCTGQPTNFCIMEFHKTIPTLHTSTHRSPGSRLATRKCCWIAWSLIAIAGAVQHLFSLNS